MHPGSNVTHLPSREPQETSRLEAARQALAAARAAKDEAQARYNAATDRFQAAGDELIKIERNPGYQMCQAALAAARAALDEARRADDYPRGTAETRAVLEQAEQRHASCAASAAAWDGRAGPWHQQKIDASRDRRDLEVTLDRSPAMIRAAEEELRAAALAEIGERYPNLIAELLTLRPEELVRQLRAALASLPPPPRAAA